MQSEGAEQHEYVSSDDGPQDRLRAQRHRRRDRQVRRRWSDVGVQAARRPAHAVPAGERRQLRGDHMSALPVHPNYEDQWEASVLAGAEAYATLDAAMDRVYGSRDADRFSALMSGDATSYGGDKSRADHALVTMLFRTLGDDVEKVKAEWFAAGINPTKYA